MPFNEICRGFFYWFGFGCFFSFCGMGLLILYHYVEFKIKTRKREFKKQDPVTEFYETLKSKV